MSVWIRCAAALLALALMLGAAYAHADPADELILNAAYTSIAVPQLVRFDCRYSDAWFSTDAKEYNHSLARVSLGMALSAFRDNRLGLAHCGDHAVEFLSSAGFEDIRSDQFDVAPSEDTIASVLAFRQMDGFTLVAAPVSGGGYGNEWLSNLNVGNETRHVGFNAAARQVERRIRDYLTEHNFHGPIKLWCAGYSRAAAVSSLVAADMTDSGLFADVFAYTFATPRVTREPGEYPNIFCILGKYDPVPAIPLGDWGYRHIGVELFTRARECDSDYFRAAQLADSASLALNGLRFRNNPSVNHDLRMVLNYLLELMPDAGIYQTVLFPELYAVWKDKDAAQFVETLSAALRRVIPKDAKQGELLSDFISYLSTLVYSRTTGANAADLRDGSWNTSGPLADNIMHEHSPDVYVSWLFSSDDPKALFTPGGSSTRLCVNGDVALEIYDEFGFLQSVDQRGVITLEPSADVVSLRQSADCPALFAVRQGTQTIVSVPGDSYYAVQIKSKDKQNVDYFATVYNTDFVRGTMTKKYSLFMDADEEYLVICSSADSDDMTLIGCGDEHGEPLSSDLVYSPSLILALEKANMFELDLITSVGLVVIIVAVILLIVLLTIIFGVIRLIRRKKRNAAVTIITHILTAGLCFLLEEGARYYMQGVPVLMSSLKGLTSFIIVLLCLKGMSRKHRTADRWICLGLIVCGTADVMMNRNMPVATLLFAAAHVLYAVGFCVEKPPRPWQYFVLAGLFALFTAVILSYRQSSPIPLQFLFTYALILSMMIAFSLRMRAGIAVGTLLFAASVILLGRNMIYGETKLSHMRALGLFYLSEFVIAGSVWLGKAAEKPERDDERESDFPSNHKKE